jgi:hypothetical protein
MPGGFSDRRCRIVTGREYEEPPGSEERSDSVKREQVRKTRQASQNRTEDDEQDRAGTVDRTRARKARRRALRASARAARFLRGTQETERS